MSGSHAQALEEVLYFDLSITRGVCVSRTVILHIVAFLCIVKDLKSFPCSYIYSVCSHIEISRSSSFSLSSYLAFR